MKFSVDDSTMLVINGVPYSLVKRKNPSDNSVCEKCDLYQLCKEGKSYGSLEPICYDEFHDSAWFFVEDWDILDKYVREYTDIKLRDK